MTQRLAFLNIRSLPHSLSFCSQQFPLAGLSVARATREDKYRYKNENGTQHISHNISIIVQRTSVGVGVQTLYHSGGTKPL
jgi:hypothetical protein